MNKLTIEEKVKKVNEVLKKNEPDNISVDTYSKMTGYKPQYVVDAMNQVFGFDGWGFDEISNELVDKDENGKPKLALANIRVWLRNGEKKVLATSYGQSRVTRGDYGDAKKGAQTDAIKKGLSYFSIGNRAYHGLLSTNSNK